MFHNYFLGILLCAAGTFALYESQSNVVNLTPSNFDKLVTDSNDVWIVEFYAPWCGHCKNLVPAYNEAASALKGVVKVGAIDADEHKSLAKKYSVTGFPTIKIFTGSKHTPYQGQRTAEALVEAGIKAVRDKAYARLGKKLEESSDKRVPKKKKRVYGHHIPWKKAVRTRSKPGRQVSKQVARTYTTKTIPVKKKQYSTLTSPINKNKLHVSPINKKNTIKHSRNTKMKARTLNDKQKFEQLKAHLFRRLNGDKSDDDPPKIVRKKDQFLIKI